MTKPTIAFVFCAVTLYLGSASLSAQTIYRIVGSDGKVTFSDKPPATLEQGRVTGTGVGASGTVAGASFSFELKQAVAKFPVTLYTAPKCAPCDAGRALLSARGVPFSERTVTTPEDGEYLKRLTGETSLPYLTIGGQRLRGLAEDEWVQYLNAAGYPATSTLPASYRNPSPAPLVALQKSGSAKVEDRVEEAEVMPSSLPAEPVGPNPANPAGIKF
jgi:glutaredoxin